uniref:CD63 antigen n=1 Tax=Aceria tosichella TaxID=561515 RepID=A0A6G1SLF2_9ACAR
MAGCVSGLCGCFTGTLLLLARAILFLNCVGMGIVWLDFIFSANKIDELGNSLSITLAEYIVAGLMLAACTIGIHATFTRDPTRLKIFALFISALALAQGVSVYGKYLAWSTDVANFNMTFKLAEPEYKWYTSNTNPSTEWVDKIQSRLGCCGIVNPHKEWDEYKPKSLAHDILPGSCCPHGETTTTPIGDDADSLCHLQFSYTDGCLVRYEEVMHFNLVWMTLGAVKLMILALLALCIAKPRDGPRLARGGPLNTQYTRFDGSVYVRRPQEQQPILSQKPPVYLLPNAPPPSYYSS